MAKSRPIMPSGMVPAMRWCRHVRAVRIRPRRSSSDRHRAPRAPRCAGLTRSVSVTCVMAVVSHRLGRRCTFVFIDQLVPNPNIFLEVYFC